MPNDCFKINIHNVKAMVIMVVTANIVDTSTLINIRLLEPFIIKDIPHFSIRTL